MVVVVVKLRDGARWSGNSVMLVLVMPVAADLALRVLRTLGRRKAICVGGGGSKCGAGVLLCGGDGGACVAGLYAVVREVACAAQVCCWCVCRFKVERGWKGASVVCFWLDGTGERGLKAGW